MQSFCDTGTSPQLLCEGHNNRRNEQKDQEDHDKDDEALERNIDKIWQGRVAEKAVHVGDEDANLMMRNIDVLQQSFKRRGCGLWVENDGAPCNIVVVWNVDRLLGVQRGFG